MIFIRKDLTKITVTTRRGSDLDLVGAPFRVCSWYHKVWQTLRRLIQQHWIQRTTTTTTIGMEGVNLAMDNLNKGASATVVKVVSRIRGRHHYRAMFSECTIAKSEGKQSLSATWLETKQDECTVWSTKFFRLSFCGRSFLLVHINSKSIHGCILSDRRNIISSRQHKSFTI